MIIKFFNLNIKHNSFIFDENKSTAEYWLEERRRAPIFFGNFTCEDFLLSKVKLKPQSHKVVQKFLTIKNDLNIKPIFITLNSGFILIYELTNGPFNDENIFFSRNGKGCNDIPKYYEVNFLKQKVPFSKIPYILASIKSNQAFAQGTFYPIGENLDGISNSKYDGNRAAIVTILKDILQSDYQNLSIDPLNCLSSVELETLISKIFEAKSCFVPAHRGGVLKDIDLFVYPKTNIEISGIDYSTIDSINIQIKLSTSESGNSLAELKSFLTQSKNNLLITSEQQPHPKLIEFSFSGQYLTSSWIKDQISQYESVSSWFKQSLIWLPDHLK